MSERVDMYVEGLFCASVCAPASMTPVDVAAATERQSPAGTEGGWLPSTDLFFKGGQPNPCPCERDPSRRHHLLEA